MGGALRDSLLNIMPTDIDLATSAKPKEILNIFKEFNNIVINDRALYFGTLGLIINHLNIEITSLKMEGKYIKRGYPSSVKFIDDINIDLPRRDFSINSMALNLKTFELIDPFNGLHDLNNKIIRAIINPSDKFNEDPLRILRGLYLSSKLNFLIDKATMLAMLEHKDSIKQIKINKVISELNKISSTKYANYLIKQILW